MVGKWFLLAGGLVSRPFWVRAGRLPRSRKLSRGTKAADLEHPTGTTTSRSVSLFEVVQQQSPALYRSSTSFKHSLLCCVVSWLEVVQAQFPALARGSKACRNSLPRCMVFRSHAETVSQVVSFVGIVHKQSPAPHRCSKSGRSTLPRCVVSKSLTDTVYGIAPLFYVLQNRLRRCIVARCLAATTRFASLREVMLT